jgi:hypothetical protein
VELNRILSYEERFEDLILRPKTKAVKLTSSSTHFGVERVTVVYKGWLAWDSILGFLNKSTELILAKLC